MDIAIQVNSLGTRCGIATYSTRLNTYLNEKKDVNAFQFVNKIRGNADVISLQYEPGLMQPQQLNSFVQRYPQPIVVTAHHMGYLPQFYGLLDGIVFHSESQIEGYDEPWEYTVIPHPALVFKKKDKNKLRKKYDLPTDKKILGTAGFIAGTGKKLPEMVHTMLKQLKDDEFLYCITSFWKGGDFGFADQIEDIVKKLGKEDQFRMDTEFVTEEVLNEKMQACDLLFAWNKFDQPGSTSGIAMDMIGTRVKTIVKNSPHYSYASALEGVETGDADQKKFVKDTLKLLRSGDLNNVPDPTPYSWETLADNYLEYFKELAGI